MTKTLGKWVEIDFDCLPLRSLAKLNVPMDASPKLAEKMQRIRAAVEKHGTLNTYYLHNATCSFHLTNDPSSGMMSYSFEGVIMTDEKDMQARDCELNMELASETCSWLNQAIVEWLGETATRAVMVEFERFIAEGDLSKTLERIEQMDQATDEAGGFVGMYL